MPETIDRGHLTGGAESAAARQSRTGVGRAVARPHAPGTLPNLDGELPDEASMEFLEKQWGRFGPPIIPEEKIREARARAAARDLERTLRRRRSHLLVRLFLAVYDWFRAPA